MWKADLDKIRELHKKYKLKGPLLDAGGLERPCIADYEKSIEKAHKVTLLLDNLPRQVVVPHCVQTDRYDNIFRPWEFIEENYLILNPEMGHSPIEELPKDYTEHFNTVILVSVFEHVVDPFICSDALFKIIKPGGYLFNSVPFMFPPHDERDNWRFSPEALGYIHRKSGFNLVEGDFHIKYTTKDGIGNYHDADELQPIIGCYAFCKKPKPRKKKDA